MENFFNNAEFFFISYRDGNRGMYFDPVIGYDKHQILRIFVFNKIDFYILLERAFMLILLSYKRYLIRFD